MPRLEHYRPGVRDHFSKGARGAGKSPPAQAYSLILWLFLRSVPLNQIPQTAQTDFFPADKRFAIAGADGPAPVTGALAQIIQKSRRVRGTTHDKLGLEAGDGLHLAF